MELLIVAFAMMVIGLCCGAQNHNIKKELKAITSRLINIQCRLNVIEDELSEIKEAKTNTAKIERRWK